MSTVEYSSGMEYQELGILKLKETIFTLCSLQLPSHDFYLVFREEEGCQSYAYISPVNAYNLLSGSGFIKTDEGYTWLEKQPKDLPDEWTFPTVISG